MDVSFYQLLKTPLEKALPKLIEKIYQSGYRILIVCHSKEHVEMLNNVLWTFSPASFLPHGHEGAPDHQPIWLSTDLINANKANLAVITNGQSVITEDFEKCIDIFDGNDPQALANAQGRYAIYNEKGCKMAFWRQTEAGNWESI